MAARDSIGRLFVVATPIGSLEDMTLRAVRVLQEVDTILAEDTRHSRKLCSHYEITTPLESFHAHTSEAKCQRWVQRLIDGARLALISDAGTPLISDPGSQLLRQTIEAGVEVEAVPGPSAVMTALCVSGLAPQPFRFEGFLARSGSKRRNAISRMQKEVGTSVIFESAERLSKTLADLEAELGPDRRIAICRELTKKHEQVIRGNIAAVRSDLPQKLKGEITVVIEGSPRRVKKNVGGPELERWVAEWDGRGLSTREMAAALAERTGLSRNEAYDAVLRCRAE